MFVSDMQGTTLRYFYDWLVDEGLEFYFRIINPKIICKGNSKYLLCETIINNELGINEIKIYKRKVVAYSLDGKVWTKGNYPFRERKGKVCDKGLLFTKKTSL